VRNQNGYSVLELLVVFVIVGLLALMAYPSVRRGPRSLPFMPRRARVRSIGIGQRRYGSVAIPPMSRLT
jgi:prepilin-type N-terminal cleavage/methylation domain-containing protein